MSPQTFIRCDRNQDPAVFKVIQINYNEKKKEKKNSKEKNKETIGFPDISDSQAVLLQGI